jgi:hypothetical protein
MTTAEIVAVLRSAATVHCRHLRLFNLARVWRPVLHHEADALRRAAKRLARMEGER